MKLYKVKHFHIGDKPYSVDDRRVAEPHEVQHLVDGDMLEEIGDTPDDAKEDSATIPGGTVASDLDKQIEALTFERDEAREKLLDAEHERDQARGEVATSGSKTADAERERDEARKLVDELTAKLEAKVGHPKASKA